MMPEKEVVRDFWDAASCGEDLYLSAPSQAGYAQQSKKRYELEPYIPGFAAFDTVAGKQVLEIGVGLGADHQRFAEGGAVLSGVDLTPRAIDHVRRRFELFGLSSELRVADAENLPFAANSFDVVYSWGVIHHSPNTPKAAAEICRILKPGGVARVMIYHKWSLVGVMLWLRYALLRGRPFMSLRAVYSRYLESPGTKAYTRAQARQLFGSFKSVRIETVLTHSDLLDSAAGQRHRGRWLSVARALWPRWLLRQVGGRLGLFMLITATK
jgi:ubiquinone/menaquinone biosynthesis C-methylase UbiE